MSKRSTALFVSLAALAVAPFAGAGETQATPEARNAAMQIAAAAKVAAGAPLPLSDVFHIVADDLDVITGPHGMTITRVTVPDVVLVRVNRDGSKETACVNSEDAARNFLAAGRTAVHPEKQPKE